MRPVVYEIKRSLTNRFSIVLIVAIIGLTALISYEGGALSTSHTGSGNTVSEVSGYYASGNRITVVSYFFDQNGNPASSVKANVSLNGTTYAGTEASPGVLEFHVISQSAASSVYLHLNYSYSSSFRLRTNSTNSMTINTKIASYSGLDIVTGISSPTNSSNLGFLLFYVGATGNHTAPPIDVNLATVASGVLNNSYLWEHQYSYFTHVSVFPSLGAKAINKTYGLYIKSGVSSLVFFKAPIGPLSLYKPFTVSSIESSFFSIESALLVIFIPLLSVFMAYFTYGKDRVTGILETVIKRPITKGGAIRSRFLANSVVVASSILVAIIISDLISYRYFHIFMPPTFILYMWWAYSVIGVSFLAISYIFSHILRSPGALLGALIAVFFIFGLFWTVIFDVIVAAFSITSGTSSYITFQVLFNYANPAGYASLFQLFITHGLGGGLGSFGSSQSINPAYYGVTPVLLIIAGVLWIGIPFAIAQFLAVKRD
ncbi:MAG: ABC transporter permease subunit [Thermoplasmatales archaeon]|nr:ABC transporter permease [Candidatus Thermoplasmatota archaeon]MCL6003521.1 ABC transporter permease [Candidatus Thermoplasmatota archaeon]MDA8055990.1 ABC transporter permease subunit [Thermoplasmatales archaeon]